METPKVWAQICIQRMVELAKESTTMRRILDPMFVYFDSGGHWVPQQGLAMLVLSDMSYFMESSGILTRFPFYEAFSNLIMNCNYVHVFSCKLLVLSHVNFCFRKPAVDLDSCDPPS